MAKSGRGTRLEKLLDLIETGSCQENRFAAGEQIISILGSHPAQIPDVLQAVFAHLDSTNWDARIAAARCLGAAAGKFVHWTPLEIANASGLDDARYKEACSEAGIGVAKPSNGEGASEGPAEESLLPGFDVMDILEHGTPLVASSGEEYAHGAAGGLAAQRSALRQKLGLGGALGGFVDDRELIKDEDLTQAANNEKPEGEIARVPSARLRLAASRRLKRSASGTQGGSDGKRRALEEKLGSRNAAELSIKEEEDDMVDEGDSSSALSALNAAIDSLSIKAETETDAWSAILAGEWALQRVCTALIPRLLSHRWETRHGAAAGLRDVLRVAAGSAGVVAPLASDAGGWMVAGGSGRPALALSPPSDKLADVVSAARGSDAFLSTTSAALLSLLALDRFSDFVGDGAVGPTRETAAQALGSICPALTDAGLTATLLALCSLARCDIWQARHGALLGLRYAVGSLLCESPGHLLNGGASGEDGIRRSISVEGCSTKATPSVLCQTLLGTLLDAMSDCDDDVRGAAADALALLASCLEPGETARVWDKVLSLLPTLDALSPAAGPFMRLARALAVGKEDGGALADMRDNRLGLPAVHDSNTIQLSTAAVNQQRSSRRSCVLRQVRPFFGHTLQSVRAAALDCAMAVLGDDGAIDGAMCSAPSSSRIPLNDLVPFLTILAPRLVLEPRTSDGRLLPRVEALWGRLVSLATTSLVGDDTINSHTKCDTTASWASSVLAAIWKAALAGPGAPPGPDCEPLPSGGDLEELVPGRLACGRAMGRMAAALETELDHLLSDKTKTEVDGLQGDRDNNNIILAAGAVPPRDDDSLQQVSQVSVSLHLAVVKESVEENLGAAKRGLGQWSTRLLTAATALYAWTTTTTSATTTTRASSLVPAAMAASTQVPPSSSGSIAAVPLGIAAVAVTAAISAGHGSVALPPKLNPYIQPLMAALRREPSGALQSLAAEGVARFLIELRTKSPSDKILKNLVGFACAELPGAERTTLQQLLDSGEFLSSEVGTRKNGSKTTALSQGKSGNVSAAAAEAAAAEATALASATITRRGGEAALRVLGSISGDALFVDVAPTLLTAHILQPLAQLATEMSASSHGASVKKDEEDGRKVFTLETERATASSSLGAATRSAAISAARLVQALAPSLTSGSMTQLVVGSENKNTTEQTIPNSSLSALLGALRCDSFDVQLAVARALAALARRSPTMVLGRVLEESVSWLSLTNAPASRRGALLLIACLLPALGPAVIPYLPLVARPLLGRMCDSDPDLRRLAAASFAAVVAILPLSISRIRDDKVTVPESGMVQEDMKKNNRNDLSSLPNRSENLGLSSEQERVLEVESGFLARLMGGGGHTGSSSIGRTTQRGSVKLEGSPEDESPLSNNRLAPGGAELALAPRPYQREGIAWLDFLRVTGLHGILADDMGLGKTLQATAVLAAAARDEAAAVALLKHRASPPRPSLILCPSTLVAHWAFEMEKNLAPGSALRVLCYAGSVSERASLAQRMRNSHKPAAAALEEQQGTSGVSSSSSSFDIVVTSYECLRSDTEVFSSREWLYVVADEGHVLSSASTRLAAAVRTLRSQHRLLLTGTPIQNGIRELWALFDWLMPGFLGSGRSFNAKYGRALTVASRAARARGGAALSSSESGVLALESLHRTVMPFVLRRTKGQVLADLPPKIIQDVRCSPTVLQQILLSRIQTGEKNNETAGGQTADQTASSAALPFENEPKTTEVIDRSNSSASIDRSASSVVGSFMALRKACTHPALLFENQEGVDEEDRVAVCQALGDEGGSHDWASTLATLRGDVAQSPKLVALAELLREAGLGGCNEGGVSSSSSVNFSLNDQNNTPLECETTDAGHRVLIFAQLKSTLDLVESLVLGPLGIASTRIDGSVDAAERFSRAQRFNADPTLGAMLLTTAVGGLGLNLTSADTVVFLEHDWNPTRDVQAMDRAHRLGQRRAVNVYRLIMAGTLEEEIMSLQAFKTSVANAVVNADNAAMKPEDAGRALDVMGAAASAALGKDQEKKKQIGLAGMLAELQDLDELSDQYASEFGGAK